MEFVVKNNSLFQTRDIFLVLNKIKHSKQEVEYG